MWRSGLLLEFSKPTFLNVDYRLCTSWTVVGVYLSVGYKSTLRKIKSAPTRFCLEPPGAPSWRSGAAFRGPGPPQSLRATFHFRHGPPQTLGIGGVEPANQSSTFKWRTRDARDREGGIPDTPAADFVAPVRLRVLQFFATDPPMLGITGVEPADQKS